MSEHMSEAAPLAVPIEWQVPGDIVPRYATNFVVQNTGHEFILSFFEIMPPIIVGGPEEQKTQVKRLKSVQAKCVARIVLSPTRMAELMQLLRDHFDLQTLSLHEEE